MAAKGPDILTMGRDRNNETKSRNRGTLGREGNEPEPDDTPFQRECTEIKANNVQNRIQTPFGWVRRQLKMLLGAFFEYLRPNAVLFVLLNHVTPQKPITIRVSHN